MHPARLQIMGEAVHAQGIKLQGAPGKGSHVLADPMARLSQKCPPIIAQVATIQHRQARKTYGVHVVASDDRISTCVRAACLCRWKHAPQISINLHGACIVWYRLMARALFM